jgi:hypothetical protein
MIGGELFFKNYQHNLAINAREMVLPWIRFPINFLTLDIWSLLGTSATVLVVCVDLYLTGAEVRTNEKNSLCKHKSYMLLLFDSMIQYNNSIHLQNKLWDFVDNK